MTATPAELKALEALKQQERVSYDVTAAAKACGITVPAFMQFVRSLSRKGYLRYEPRGTGKNPTIEVLK